MKTRIFSCAAFFGLFLFLSGTTVCALSVENLLDKAVSLAGKGDNTGAAGALKEGTTALENEAKSSDGSLKTKLLGKVGDLKALLPLVSGGKAPSGVLGKVVNAVKMLLGANRISSLLGKGNNGLLGKAAGITSNLGLIKAGSSILGGSAQSKLGGLIADAGKSVSALDKSGLAGNLAAKAAAPQLSGIVKMVDSLI